MVNIIYAEIIQHDIIFIVTRLGGTEMDNFNRMSLFPVYIDMPLKKYVEDYLLNQRNMLSKKSNESEEITELEDLNKLLISFQSDFDMPHKFCAFRYKDQMIIPRNNTSASISSISDFSDIESVEIIQEGDAVLGADELQTLISTVLKLINK